MTEDHMKPKWAPRLPQRLIQRLYESDARGILDRDLLDDVGIRLYLRCQSIETVLAIRTAGRLPCPACGAAVPCERRLEAKYTLRCDACGWQLAWAAYWVTFRHQELAHDVFVSDFISDWQAARTARAKMLAIDRVIHRWHNAERTKGEYGLGRPSGVNLIEGNRRQVLEFLDALTYSGGIAAASGHHDSWLEGRAKVQAVQDSWNRARQERSGTER